MPVETDLEDLENPLDNDRIGSDESCLIPNIVSDDGESVDIAPGEGKHPIPLLLDEFCEEFAFPYLLPSGKFGYKIKGNVPLSHTKYFNSRLLNYSQRFSSCSDYIFFAHFV